MEFRRIHVPGALFAISLAICYGACGNPNGLPPAYSENTDTTVSLFALDGTPLSVPSGFRVQDRAAVRTDLTASFDFAFNITTTGDAVLLPTGALGLGVASGIAPQTTTFDSVLSAPQTGYVDTSAVKIDSGSVAVVRSRPIQCGYGLIVYYYGKLQVIQIDTVARRVDLRVLVDQNCGYRGLEPGIPSK
jgi:hypothetical protein